MPHHTHHHTSTTHNNTTVRSWARTRGRNCSPSRAHPRRQLMWTRCRGWSLWPSSSSSLTRLGIRSARIHPTGRGSRRTSICSIASSPMRGIVLSNLRPGPTRLQETMMVRGDGIECSVWSRHCDHAAAVPAARRFLGAFSSVHRQSGGLSSCMLILVRTVHTVHQTVEISQLQFLGWLSTRLLLCSVRCSGWSRRKLWSLRSCSGCGRRPVLGQGRCARWCNDWGPRNAWFDYGSMLCIIQGGFWKNFMIFYVTGCLGS